MSKTVQCGVTIAMPVSQLPKTPADIKTLSAMTADFLAEELKMHTKGAAPRSDLRFQVQDSVMDPLQGHIVPMTLQADFYLEDLPTDSDAYQAHQKGARP